MLPTGWTVGDSDRSLPRLESRKPRLPTPSDLDMESPGAYATASTSEESSTEDLSSGPPLSTSLSEASTMTRMESESSDDSSLPTLEVS